MATAEINYVGMDHDQWLNNQKGMIIHVRFDVQGLAGEVGNVGAYFNYWQGGPLRDYDGAYRTEDGHVYVGEDFIPDLELQNYPDAWFFMPYNQFHLTTGISVDLMFMIRVLDKSQIAARWLANSEWIPFNYNNQS